MATDDVSCTAHVELAGGTTADDARKRAEAILDDRFGTCTARSRPNEMSVTTPNIATAE
jgi:hypothetical protein